MSLTGSEVKALFAAADYYPEWKDVVTISADYVGFTIVEVSRNLAGHLYLNNDGGVATTKRFIGVNWDE